MKLVDQRDPQTYAIIGAALEIHRQLRHGFLEAVYQEAAVVEFPLNSIPFEREVSLPIKYSDVTLPTHYRADFVCFPKSSSNSRHYLDCPMSKKLNCSTISKTAG